MDISAPGVQNSSENLSVKEILAKSIAEKRQAIQEKTLPSPVSPLKPNEPPMIQTALSTNPEALHSNLPPIMYSPLMAPPHMMLFPFYNPFQPVPAMHSSAALKPKASPKPGKAKLSNSATLSSENLSSDTKQKKRSISTETLESKKRRTSKELTPFDLLLQAAEQVLGPLISQK